MTGGGETPFSPTLWLFDTGAAPESMNQNCIAGTTEFDEENGVGLILYANSGNNVIVYALATGLPVGYTFPAGSDYLNMLKSLYQEKTGETISYFGYREMGPEAIQISDYLEINE